ncbi:MAG TPA: hypothetical protein PK819_13035, partial [Thermomicrobiales bacterium]|nr:hypothetical protein [Thermomicrobiales bacterium]
AENGEGRGSSPTKRFLFPLWQSGDDHELCPHALIANPVSRPHLTRTGTAHAPLRVVDRDGAVQLLCNCLHEGPCAWPWFVGDA